MGSGEATAGWISARARLGLAFGLLFALQVGASGCDISMNEPMYGNYNRAETSPMQRRSDIRACEQRHYRSSGGPGTRSAGVTEQRVQDCLERAGYARGAKGR